MKFIIVCAFLTVVAASRNHQLVVVKPEIPTTEYREQDSKGFYSFGYSGEESAKAEYKTRDGSSKGFYSYIDSDGKLQTVKYEAGRRQGFTASATNLPAQPVDNSIPPEPVTDTPEVEMAKQAHFEAYREAAIKAAMEPDTGLDETDESELRRISAEADSSVELQQNTRELLLSRQNSRDQLLTLLREHEEERAREEQQSQLMTTYILSAQAEARAQGSAQALAQARIGQPNHPELRTVYRMDNGDSNVVLKVGNGNGNDNGDGHGNGNGNEIVLSDNGNDLSSIVQNSHENSFYTVDNPNTHYTVEIPTVLTTLPRIESIRVGHLPLAKSTTYITQRLKSTTF